MATQQTTTENKKAESERKEGKELEISRSSQAGLERGRPRSWFGFPRWMRRGWPSYDVFSASPFDLMRRMTEDMDRMFADMWPQETAVAWPEETTLWAPELDVVQKGDELIVRADLPGVKKEDLRVELLDNALVLEGERRHEAERREGSWMRAERSYGAFRRTIPLPEAARGGEPSATFEDGVLEIRLKNPQARGKRIEIKGPGETPKVH